MGEIYYLIDDQGRNGLDVDKFHALHWVASGRRATCDDLERARVGWPVTIAMVREASSGWTPSLGPAHVQAAAESARLAVAAERWIINICDRRQVRIVEQHHAPWAAEVVDGAAEASPPRWGRLYTLYTHPVTREPTPKTFELFTGRVKATARQLRDNLRAELSGAGFEVSGERLSGRIMVRLNMSHVLVELPVTHQGIKWQHVLNTAERGYVLAVLRATLGVAGQMEPADRGGVRFRLRCPATP